MHVIRPTAPPTPEEAAEMKAPVLAYGFDSGPMDLSPMGGGQAFPDEGLRFSIEVAPYKGHVLTHLFAAPAILEAVELLSISIGRTRPSLGVPAEPAPYTGGIEKTEEGWVLCGLALVEVMDPVVVELRLTKPLDRVTLGAVGEMHPMDIELTRLFRALRAEKHPAMSVYDERWRMVNIALARARNEDPSPMLECEGFGALPPFALAPPQKMEPLRRLPRPRGLSPGATKLFEMMSAHIDPGVTIAVSRECELDCMPETICVTSEVGEAFVFEGVFSGVQPIMATTAPMSLSLFLLDNEPMAFKSVLLERRVDFSITGITNTSDEPRRFKCEVWGTYPMPKPLGTEQTRTTYA